MLLPGNLLTTHLSSYLLEVKIALHIVSCHYSNAAFHHWKWYYDNLHGASLNLLGIYLNPSPSSFTSKSFALYIWVQMKWISMISIKRLQVWIIVKRSSVEWNRGMINSGLMRVLLVLQDTQRGMICIRSSQKGVIAKFLIFCHAVNQVADVACIFS